MWGVVIHLQLPPGTCPLQLCPGPDLTGLLEEYPTEGATKHTPPTTPPIYGIFFRFNRFLGITCVLLVDKFVENVIFVFVTGNCPSGEAYYVSKIWYLKPWYRILP